MSPATTKTHSSRQFAYSESPQLIASAPGQDADSASEDNIRKRDFLETAILTPHCLFSTQNRLDSFRSRRHRAQRRHQRTRARQQTASTPSSRSAHRSHRSRPPSHRDVKLCGGPCDRFGRVSYCELWATASSRVRQFRERRLIGKQLCLITLHPDKPQCA